MRFFNKHFASININYAAPIKRVPHLKDNASIKYFGHIKRVILYIHIKRNASTKCIASMKRFAPLKYAAPTKYVDPI